MACYPASYSCSGGNQVVKTIHRTVPVLPPLALTTTEAESSFPKSPSLVIHLPVDRLPLGERDDHAVDGLAQGPGFSTSRTDSTSEHSDKEGNRNPCAGDHLGRADVSRNRKVPFEFNSDVALVIPPTFHWTFQVRGRELGLTFPRPFRNVRLHPSAPGSYDGREGAVGQLSSCRGMRRSDTLSLWTDSSFKPRTHPETSSHTNLAIGIDWTWIPESSRGDIQTVMIRTAQLPGTIVIAAPNPRSAALLSGLSRYDSMIAGRTLSSYTLSSSKTPLVHHLYESIKDKKHREGVNVILVREKPFRGLVFVSMPPRLAPPSSTCPRSTSTSDRDHTTWRGCRTAYVTRRTKIVRRYRAYALIGKTGVVICNYTAAV